MATLTSLIEDALKSANREKMHELLKIMEQNGYYTCKSSSHNHWDGGAAEHMWATYIYAKLKRDKILKDKPYLLKYATDEKLAMVCLLHDLCDMKVTVIGQGKDYSEGYHGEKSYWIMRNMPIGTYAEREAVLHHMHSGAKSGLKDPDKKMEYEALHTIISTVDHWASGTAWNSDRFIAGLTQSKGVASSPGYLRSVALDRTKQCINYKVYMGHDLFPYEIKGYARTSIRWNFQKDAALTTLIDGYKPDNSDIISSLRKKHSANSLLIVGVSPDIPRDANTRLRGDWRYEQDLLICSNILLAFYSQDKHVDTKKKHHYGFTMIDEIKQHYQNQSPDKGIFLPQVTFFRDGASEGFRMVAPWTCDVLLVPGWKGCVCMER